MLPIFKIFGLRQSQMWVCPHPLSFVWRREVIDVLLSHQGVLSLLPFEEAGGVGRVDAGGASP